MSLFKGERMRHICYHNKVKNELKRPEKVL